MISAARTWVNSYVAALSRAHDLRPERPVWEMAGSHCWSLTLHSSQWSASAILDAEVLDHAFRGDEREHASVLRTIHGLVHALASAVVDPVK